MIITLVNLRKHADRMAQLAEAIDKAFETISNLERGKTAPNFSTLQDIAEVFKVPMCEFFEDMDEELSSQRQQLFTLINQPNSGIYG